ncbi:YceD family protein [Desertimonas flava]|uniref:YceD family protein n=1 Tax=Desertimonas flava TaxID=2064846 RepID=UPI0013C423FE|nr:DUF177 domain-containing protein [Desertimonas flava]
MPAPRLLINVAELQREPGGSKHVVDAVDATDVDAAHPAISGPVGVDVTIESTVGDLLLHGTIDVPWLGVCRRCLEPLARTLHVEVDERYSEDPAHVESGEAAPVVRGQIDLRDLVRDEVLLALDAEQVCRPDCAGLCPTCGHNLNDGPCGCDAPAVDDRWSALDALRVADETPDQDPDPRS